MILRFFWLTILFILASCTNIEKSIKDKAVYKEFIGYEFVTDIDYFITIEDGELFLRTPRDEQDSMRNFIGLPTIEGFKSGMWDSSNYKGSDKYLDILPSGTKMKVVDVVMSKNIVIGITYDYYATIIDCDKYMDVSVNINSLVDLDHRGVRKE
ncbi:hypothetical protein [Trichloromonas sp.]|uniref:hypothetical protein n=1 Tax=Trichloromonas sp. TaxID=3069249 RepID=UPI003D816B97